MQAFLYDLPEEWRLWLIILSDSFHANSKAISKCTTLLLLTFDHQNSKMY